MSQLPTCRARPKSSHHSTVLHLLSADTTTGELAHTGLNQPCPLSRHGDRPRLLGKHKNFTLTFLTLEEGPMSQECPLGNSNTEHRTEPNHPQQAEEVTTTRPTPNRFWRMMTDPGFPSPASNPAPFIVTAEAFLGLTNQVRGIANSKDLELMQGLVYERRSVRGHPKVRSELSVMEHQNFLFDIKGYVRRQLKCATSSARC
ncbi:hypothetical protein B296_00020556 [Ensete ventricosum]|uniref:Uncharacterized protein n=1 Tax=Ensete ventricosum TaxID=4639 RepID=A0A426XL90_ENSVE|nr:hypothetical protein B296_00020556 [Ensete ventricosum]